MAVLLEKNFPVEAGAFTTAGEASTTIKRTLKQLGIGAEVLRRVSVACYKAMTEGFSTASDEARTLGFGAGMGLPNMKRNASEFDIQSEVGVGTTITMSFALQ